MPKINVKVAVDIASEADPLLAISHPLRFKDMVRDIVYASGEPTLSKAKVILAPYGTLIPVLLQAVVGWKLSPDERISIKPPRIR